MPKSYQLEVQVPKSGHNWKLSAIPIWQTIPLTPFGIYKQSIKVIELDMSIIGVVYLNHQVVTTSQGTSRERKIVINMSGQR